MVVESAYSCEKALGSYWIKGYLVLGIAIVAFYLIGYSLSYDETSSWFGSDNTLLSEQIDFSRFGVYVCDANAIEVNYSLFFACSAHLLPLTTCCFLPLVVSPLFLCSAFDGIVLHVGFFIQLEWKGE
jgi:ammonia channel protein AmtB